jgi:hypothetical protein
MFWGAGPGKERLQSEKGIRGKPHLAEGDGPGLDTGRSQGHLSTYPIGGAPGQRHRAPRHVINHGCNLQSSKQSKSSDSLGSLCPEQE